MTDTPKPLTAQGDTMTNGISVSDLERAMGKKADHVSDYVFDPKTGSFSRLITFKLSREEKPIKRRRTLKQQGET